MRAIAWSTSSWPTSRRSCTPEAVPAVGRPARLVGTLRLAHPFPSLVDGGATLSIALLVGAAPVDAVRLAASMVCLQASIGALNDLVDVRHDAGRKVGKPIPSGAATPALARALVVAGLVLGLGLAAPSGAPTVLVAVLGVSCGYAYDLKLSRTVWSWLPLSIALPLLPLYAWLGGTGAVPAGSVALIPIAVLAGAGLALSNGLADLERDRLAGAVSAVVRLGRTRAWAVHACCLALAAGLATFSLPRDAPALAAWGMAVGTSLLVLGASLSRGGGPGRRERAWEAQAIGVAVLGAAWIGAIGAAG